MMNEMLYFAVSSMFFLCVLILPVVLVFYAIRMLDYVEALLMKAPDAFVHALFGDDPVPVLRHSSLQLFRLFRSLRSLFALLTHTFAFLFNCHADLDYDFDGGFLAIDSDGSVDDNVGEEEEEEKEEEKEEAEEENEDDEDKDEDEEEEKKESWFAMCFDDKGGVSSEDVSSEETGGNAMSGQGANNVRGYTDRPEPREVRFDRVQIREYQVVQCQHHQAKGIRLTLGDHYLATKSVDLDSYEASKVRKDVNRLSFREKVDRLWEMGEIFTKGEGAPDASARSRKVSFDRVQIREYPVVRNEWGESLGLARHHMNETIVGVDGLTEMSGVEESKQVEEEDWSRPALRAGRVPDVLDYSDALEKLIEVHDDESEESGLALDALSQDDAESEQGAAMGSLEVLEVAELMIVEEEEEEEKECLSGPGPVKALLEDVVDWSDALAKLFQMDDGDELEDFSIALNALFRDTAESGREPIIGLVEIMESGQLIVVEDERSATTKRPRRQGLRPRKTTDVVDWAISMEELFETPLLRRSARLKAKPSINYSGM